MNNRLLHIRKSFGLNQSDFADKLNLTKNYISLIETGARVPSDRTISDICRIFNVNEVWLRTGVGEPFIQLSREEPEEDKILRLLRKSSPAVRLAIITLLEACSEGGEDT